MRKPGCQKIQMNAELAFTEPTSGSRDVGSLPSSREVVKEIKVKRKDADWEKMVFKVLTFAHARVWCSLSLSRPYTPLTIPLEVRGIRWMGSGHAHSHQVLPPPPPSLGPYLPSNINDSSLACWHQACNARTPCFLPPRLSLECVRNILCTMQ